MTGQRAKRERKGFTDRELDIMSVLWRDGSGTVAEVRESLGSDVGYTTVLKMLQIMEEKGAVRHEREAVPTATSPWWSRPTPGSGRSHGS